MKNRKLYFFLGSSLIVVIAGLGIIFLSSNRVSDSVKIADEEQSGQVAGEQTNTQDNQKSDAWIEGLSIALKEKGAVMYGAYWCSHCNNQKNMFGDFVKNIDFVECDPEGPNSNADECTAKGITGYPTWIYQGKQHTGEQSLDTLADMIGYTGPTASKSGDN